MRTLPKWVNKIHEADKVQVSSIHTICFNPDGTQLVVGAGEKVMVYDPRDGALVQLLQAHKGTVYTVAYCGDGKKFASGSADKNVIIWTSKMEGILKYSHSEAIQCLAYNPVSLQLASCAISDFAFWSMDVKAVQKHRVSGRITSCAWSLNGQYLAIGLAIGAVSIRNKIGEETNRILRDSAVWAVAFSKTSLLVADWNETLSFYNVYGQQQLKERNIGVAALSISLLGAVVVVGGVGGWAVLTAEGVPILNTPQDWVWAVASVPSLNTLAVGCQDGALWCYQVVFSTVHGLYRERYAYRENMTDVIIQHLTTGNKVRIKCHDRVQKIAIYKHRLAVQLPERVLVYEQSDAEGMLYRVKEKLPQKTECSLLVATSDALLLCQDRRLEMIGRGSGRSWELPAAIRYIKVTTLNFREVLLLGLANAQVWQVEPCGGEGGGSARVLVEGGAGGAAVRCLDVSASRSRLAVVDDTSRATVYDLSTREPLYTEENVSSVSWNSWCDELLCLSGGGVLSIKAGHFPPATQPLPGSVVGFQGGRVFCLQASAMQSVQVPLSHAVHQYVEARRFQEAHAAASASGTAGATPREWERVGRAALDHLCFEVARKAFQRTENILFLTFIDHLQERSERGSGAGAVHAETLAYCGRYGAAADAFRAAGEPHRALHLYLDLRMFNKAQEFVGTEGVEGTEALGRRRAEWARHVSEPRVAAEMYLAAGDLHRAAELLARTGHRDMLVALARRVAAGGAGAEAGEGAVRCVAEALLSVSEHSAAADIYQRLGDYKKVCEVAVAAGEWARAFALAKEHSECGRAVYLPYAHRMVQEDNFIEAQKAYYMAGERRTALRVFSAVVASAVAEERFRDAARLHHLLADTATDTDTTDTQAGAGSRLARLYHAYESAHATLHEPFSLSAPDALLHAARYALALTRSHAPHPPPGVSLFCLYLCIAKQAKSLNANTLANQMLDKILGLQIPQKFQESVELLTLKGRAGGGGVGVDEGETGAVCWRCRRHVPADCSQRCPHCNHELVHSLATYEVLPLVRFEPEEGISHEEAVELIDRAPLPAPTALSAHTQILTIDEDQHYADPFLDNIQEDDDSGVVRCSRAALLDLNPATVLVIQHHQSRPVFYRNMLPELPVTSCPNCLNLFYLEDYEIQMATKGECSFCRHPADEVGTNSDEGDSDDSTPDSPSNTTHSWR